VVISICLAFWSLMTSVGGLAQGFWQLAATRVGVAVGESGAGPASHSMLMDLYGVGRRGTVIGLLSGMQAIGIGGGVLLGGVLSQAFGWRAAFFLVGVPGILLALVVRFAIKEPPRGLSEEVQVHEPTAPPMGQVLRRLFGTPGYVLSVATVGLGGLGGYGMLNWGPTFFVRVHHMSMAQVGVAFGLTTAAALFTGIVLSGVLADWAARRDLRAYMWVASAGPLLCIPFGLWFVFEQDWRIALVAYFLMTFIEAPHNNCSYAMAQTLTPVRMRAISSVIMGLTTTVIGIGVGPLLIGASNDLLEPRFGDEAVRYSLALIMLGFLGAAVTGSLSTLFVKRDYARLLRETAEAAQAQKTDEAAVVNGPGLA
jgi:MFS family permease